MGVFSGKDHFFSSKWITAEIFDDYGRMHLVPIKNDIDGYFIATINKQVYTFKVEPTRIKLWYATFTKSFRVLLYTTKHYMPISPEHAKELEMVILKNGLPHIDRMMFNILEQLGRTEGKKFKSHNLLGLKKQAKDKPDLHSENQRNIATYLSDLNVDEIVTPLRDITEFLHDDFIATDSKFVASVGENMVRADIEDRKITNTPKGAKKSWAKIIALLMIPIVIIGLIFLVISSGVLDGGLPGLPTFGAPQLTTSQAAQKYPTPESARIAIDQGQAKLSDFPPDFQKYIKDFKPPKVTPKENTVVLTP